MKKLKILTFLLLCIFTTFNVNAQKEKKNKLFSYVNRLIRDTVAEEKSQFMMYPTIGYEPETSVEIGFSPLYVYFANEDIHNRLSEISGFAFYTLKNQFGARFEHAIYSDKDEWFFLGELEFQRFPLPYYGVRSEQEEVPLKSTAIVDARQFQIKERVLRRVRKNFFIGFEADFRSLSKVEFEPGETGDELSANLPFGAEGTTNLGLGVGLVYDERHNVLNVRDGFFSELGYVNFNPFWESDVKYHNIITDTRFFKSFNNKRNVLAAQFLGEFNFGGNIPFNQLALMGGKNMMRGYFQGRYRDNKLLATQVEYRMLPLKLGFTDRWGATVFSSLGTVFDEFKNIDQYDLKWAVGGGIRFLLFQKKDIFARLDYAITPDENGFYITIGEAF
ncbi:BamA/TamA family outer membrane protein [Psychroflexus planctonicus]|uniref:Membrane protein n=1 Tax=Psychroflexus planctonicus TaxID=1526575 RepID=A0ABQ1SKR7_9FLAO|nr:BamA/TamA family outer membrane protein [Psychroflexus planctonicus]GGE39547.1 membrane protein [Psychroflexus planctonicus]